MNDKLAPIMTRKLLALAILILSLLVFCYLTFWRPYGCGEPQQLVDRQMLLDRQISDLHVTHTSTPFRDWTGQCYAVHRLEQRIGSEVTVTTIVVKLNAGAEPTVVKRQQCVGNVCSEPNGDEESGAGNSGDSH